MQASKAPPTSGIGAMEQYDVTLELERKTVDAFHELVARRMTNTITDSEMKEGLKCIWATSSGLINKDIADLIQLDESLFEDAITQRTLINYDSGAVVVLKHNRDSGALTMVSIPKNSAGKTSEIPISCKGDESPSSAAFRMLNDLTSALTGSKGYSLI